MAVADRAVVWPTNSRKVGSKSPVASPSRYSRTGSRCVVPDARAYFWTICDWQPSGATAAGTSATRGTCTSTAPTPTPTVTSRGACVPLR